MVLEISESLTAGKWPRFLRPYLSYIDMVLLIDLGSALYSGQGTKLLDKVPFVILGLFV